MVKGKDDSEFAVFRLVLVQTLCDCCDGVWRNRKTLVKIFLGSIVIYFVYTYVLVPRGPVKRRYSSHIIPSYPLSYFENKFKSDREYLVKFTNHRFYHELSQRKMEQFLTGEIPRHKFNRSVLRPNPKFNINEDVIVFLHMQKAGGTVFNDHLIHDLELEIPCNCTSNYLMNPCYCFNKHKRLWLYSWFTIGWPCGLHADWTELKECLDSAVDEIEGIKRKRRYMYITFLRDPLQRYLSEWRHQRGGNHWQAAKLHCNGVGPKLFDVRPCFQNTWDGVSLEEFMDCQENLATNRQTRMLSDLTLSNCYFKHGITKENRSRIMLQSAMENLKSMPFFGVTEQQDESRRLFEQVFGLKFRGTFQTNVASLEDDHIGNITEEDCRRVMKYIDLDIQLYQFARDLFTQRLTQLKD